MKRVRVLAAHPSEAVRIALMGSLWVALHLYAGRPLLVAAHAGGVAPFLAWSGLVCLSFVSILPFLARRDSRLRSAAHWIGYASMSVFAMLLVLVLASDVFRLGYTLVRCIAPARVWPLLDPRTISLTLLGGALALTTIGLVQARHPRVVRLRVPIDDLPPELDGYRIVQWSDVHVGPTIRSGFVRSLVERTNELSADAVVITGDLVDGYVDDLRDEVRPLRELTAKDGVFFVTGNHEYYWRAREWVAEIAELGATFLKNEHRVIRRGEARLVMAGITDPAGRNTHQPNVAAALKAAPRDAVKVLLSHRPQAAEEASKLGAHLQLSGHTHGGQFFPFNLVIRWFQPIVAGLHKVGSTWLYVSRGTGYWGPPSRLGVGG